MLLATFETDIACTLINNGTIRAGGGGGGGTGGMAETVVIQVHPQVVRFLTKQNGVGRLMGHREDLHGFASYYVGSSYNL